MKLIYTERTRLLQSMKVVSLFFFLLISSSFYSCNSSAQENLQKDSDSEELKSGNNEKVFSFHKMTNGKDNYWKVVFKDGEVAELYKNGKKIPDENIKDYKGMISDELADLNDYHFELPRHNFHFQFNREALDSAMKQLHESLSHKDFGWVDSAFNSKEFRSEMDSLKNSLSGLKKMKLYLPEGKFDFHFDTSAFNKGMRELRENLKNMKFNSHDFKCDMGAFREGMEHNRFNSEDFKIDMEKFSHQMEKFKDEMKSFHFDMEKFKKERKTFKSFMKDIRGELVKDKLIKNEDEKFDMKMNSKEMFINGNKVPDNLFKKYKEIYQQHYGKEIEKEFDINTN
ncbi:MAG: hypothetical protein M1480_15640 [Bacteroidetes bacterium]|nr:hypothetical protein [Bacteroidota bacterium]